MALNNNNRRLWSFVLVIAAVLFCLACGAADATAAPRLLKHSNPMVYYPQGCRCCWFIWKPVIRCGDVCCGDGCTCT